MQRPVESPYCLSVLASQIARNLCKLALTLDSIQRSNHSRYGMCTCYFCVTFGRTVNNKIISHQLQFVDMLLFETARCSVHKLAYFILGKVCGPVVGIPQLTPQNNFGCWVGNCLIQLAIVNHLDCHFKFQGRSRDAKVIGRQSV